MIDPELTSWALEIPSVTVPTREPLLAIVWAPGVKGAVVLSLRGGDFLYESGQDLAIGYSHHDAETVHLYLEESFSFVVATPEADTGIPSIQQRRDRPQLRDETPQLALACRRVGLAQQRRGMDRRHDMRGERRGNEFAAPPGDAEVAAEQGLRGGGAETDDDVGREHGDLRLEPGMTGLDLARPRLAVEPPLAALHPFEVLHRVGDIDEAAIDPGRGQGTVEQPPGGTDEGQAGAILGIARLLADQHQPRLGRPGAEHRLGRVPVERATGAG